MASSPITADMRAMGIGVEVPEFTEEDATLHGLDMSDPDTAAFVASMEELRSPTQTAMELRGEQADESGQGSTDDSGGSGEPLAPPVPLTEPPGGGETPVDPALAGNANYVVDLGGGAQAELDQDMARRLVALGQWANGLPEQTRNLMAQVESGAGNVIPREEYAAYQAWKAAGSKPGAAPAGTAPPFDPDDASPVELALWQQVQDLRAQGEQQFNQNVQQEQHRQQVQLQAQVEERGALFEAEWLTAGAEMNLTPAEINRALQYAGETRMIAEVSQQQARFSPTGQILAEGDPRAIARTVLDRAVHTLPDLRDKVIQAQVDARLETERAAIIKTNEKKNRAGSLASAPSAATTTGRDPRTMTPQQREAGIAQALRDAMAE